MLGDKIRSFLIQLKNQYRPDAMFHVVVKQIDEELDELIKAKEERDTLKARVEELEKELFNANKWASHYEDKYNELKEGSND